MKFDVTTHDTVTSAVTVTAPHEVKLPVTVSCVERLATRTARGSWAWSIGHEVHSVKTTLSPVRSLSVALAPQHRAQGVLDVYLHERTLG